MKKFHNFDNIIGYSQTYIFLNNYIIYSKYTFNYSNIHIYAMCVTFIVTIFAHTFSNFSKSFKTRSVWWNNLFKLNINCYVKYTKFYLHNVVMYHDADVKCCPLYQFVWNIHVVTLINCVLDWYSIVNHTSLIEELSKQTAGFPQIWTVCISRI